MNLDLLKKLTRLANNNPNENEANLAARKVCKLLEENNFKFSETIKGPEIRNPFDYQPSQRQRDWMGFDRGAWSDPFIQREQQRRDQEAKEKAQREADRIKEEAEKAAQEARIKQEQERIRREGFGVWLR